MSKNIVDRLIEFNKDRIPALRKIKYRNMRANELAFFRGSCHIFYEDWPAGSILNKAPLSWVCGDLHLENFGSYMGADQQVYFDINDFDEGALAPCTWDVTRFLTSLILAGKTQHKQNESIQILCKRFLDVYFATLAKGLFKNLEQENANGLVKKLIRDVKSRKRTDFLDERTRKTKTGRKFRTDYPNFLPVTSEDREMVARIVKTLARHKANPDFYKTKDVAFRIAGTGSLGIRRYVALIEENDSRQKNLILDIKEARCSALIPTLQTTQPEWENQAARTTAIERNMQGMPPAILESVVEDDRAYVVKELQPLQDRISLDDWADKNSQALELSATMAEIAAWAELRSAGKRGAAEVKELMEFGRQATFSVNLMDYANDYALKARHDYELFVHACEEDLLV